jgi:small subunit ribosomal protein S9
VAKETEASEAAQTSEEMETIEEIPETAEATETTEVAAETEAVQGPEEETIQPVAEEAAEEQAAEVTETLEAPQAEATEVAEEAKPGEEEVTEAAQPAEPAEAIGEAAELAEELPREADIYYYGTGRRKASTAQVRLYPSKEPEITVNAKQADQYFSRPTDIKQLKQPLQATATENRFRITVKVQGGGISGQAGAIRHGIARALTKANPELRPTLRKAGFLTRDPRVKERKKPGLKRARKAPQYTKR